MTKITLLGALFLLLIPGLAAQQSTRNTVETLQLDGQTVKIVRDHYGVPRVFAKTLKSLFAADGYAVAEDRAWQLEEYRLDAEGMLAEVFGKRFIQHDEEVRRDGLTRDELREEFTRLPRRDQQILQAYADGVNHYFEHAEGSGSFPPEFKKYGVKPAVWTIGDSMAIMAMMSRRFGGSGVDQLQNEVAIQYLSHRLGRRKALEIFDDLAWVNDPAAIPTIARADEAEGRQQKAEGGRQKAENGKQKAESRRQKPETRVYRASPAHLSETCTLDNRCWLPSAFCLLPSASCRDASTDSAGLTGPGASFFDRLSDEMNSTSVFAAAKQLGLATRWGSYTWVLSPSKTASGHAFLLGGPQMGFTTPQIAHEIQLTGAGVNVIGMDFAGIPGVLIGANNHLAWTSTSGETHNEDVFVEKLKPGDPHEYFYRGAWRPMEHLVEPILVKGGATVNYDIYRTVHGPVSGWSPDGTVAYAKAMTYFGKEYQNIIGFLGLNTAERIQDIPPLCKEITSNHNIIVATENGHIGFWHCGLFPVYPTGVDPRLPLQGTGEDDWRGFIPFDQIPQTVDPKTGTIFNWNNKPALNWKNYSVPAWGVVFRISNIRNALDHRLKANGGKVTFTEALSIAPEIGRHNFRADYLKPDLLAAARRHPSELTPEMRQALAYLEHWDDQAREDGVSQTIFAAWYERVRWDLFHPVVGDLGSAKNYGRFINPSSVYHVLAGPKSSVKISCDYLAGRTADEVQLQALREALEQLRRERGPEMSTWAFHFPWIKFDPLPSIPWYDRGTYIQAVELDPAGVHGVWILPPGESEDPGSPHYQDQLYLASWWMYTPMRLMSPPVVHSISRTSLGSLSAVQFYDQPALEVARLTDPTGGGGYSDSASIRGSRMVRAYLSSPDSAQPSGLAQPQRSGASPASLARMKRAAEQEPSEANFERWASALLAQQRYPLATEAFQQGLARYADSARLWTGLGISLYSQDRYTEAVRALLRAARLDPAQVQVYGFLEESCRFAARCDPEVGRLLKRFVEVKADNAQAHYDYALVLWRRERSGSGRAALSEAEAQLKTAIALNPGFAQAHLQLGAVYDEEKRMPEAISQYRTVTRLRPGLAAAHYRLAQDYRLTGNSAQARAELETYERLTGNESKVKGQRSRVKF
jgi:acyl-homoserine lactone acylase PvdQ/tetratricopeptide (TPR) repeat protein